MLRAVCQGKLVETGEKGLCPRRSRRQEAGSGKTLSQTKMRMVKMKMRSRRRTRLRDLLPPLNLAAKTEATSVSSDGSSLCPCLDTGMGVGVSVSATGSGERALMMIFPIGTGIYLLKSV